MLSRKEISHIAEKITRRFEIELPLQFDEFNVNDDKLYISFNKEGERARTFELAKGIVLEFDNESRIIGLNIDSVAEFLPKPSSDFTEV